MKPFIGCQSSCNKSLKRCARGCKTELIEKYMFYFAFWEDVCRFIPRTYLVLVMHVPRVSNRGHHRITFRCISLQYNIRYLNNLSLVGISDWNTYTIFFLFFNSAPMFFFLSLAGSLSLSLSLLFIFSHFWWNNAC